MTSPTAVSAQPGGAGPSGGLWSIFAGVPLLANYRFTTLVTLSGTIGGAADPQIGIYAAYADPGHCVEGLIEPGTCACFAVHIRGTTTGTSRYTSSPLPPGFRAADTHRISVTRSTGAATGNAGAVFTFSLDGRAQAQVIGNLGPGQAGLVTKGAYARYTSISVPSQLGNTLSINRTVNASGADVYDIYVNGLYRYQVVGSAGSSSLGPAQAQLGPDLSPSQGGFLSEGSQPEYANLSTGKAWTAQAAPPGTPS